MDEKLSKLDPVLLKEDAVRLEHLKAIRGAGLDPYPARSLRTHTLLQAKNLFLQEESVGTIDGFKKITLAGRIMAKRDIGKLIFCRLRDASGELQVVFYEQEFDYELFKFFSKNFDLGDFIEASGIMHKTKTGEISLKVESYKMLSKALLPLPEKWHGLTDLESRYRQRYLDLISNDESLRIAKIRSVVVREIRNYFDTHGFYEVETPILQTLYGGALAKPFATYHNALDIPLYLRIAPELYLKRLLVGGFEKVYEIAKCFRNEGIDHNHNPEFTQIEFYWAYADYKDLMDLIEDLLPKLVLSAGLPLIFEVEGQTVDFSLQENGHYPRVTMRELIKRFAKIDIEDYPDEAAMFAVASKLEVGGVDKTMDRGVLVDEIYKKFARPNIINPIFVIDHPVELSPLAKRKANDPRYVERLQLLCVGGNELCNAFTELNDPLDQEERFRDQERHKDAGNQESMPFDEDYVTALKHGMPPAAGVGMGIDRLIKLLVNAHNLKEVILFPTLRPELHSEEQADKFKDIMVAHVVLLNTLDIPTWSKLNASAHLAAAFGARLGKKLIYINETTTLDGEKIPMNIQHAIIMKETKDQADLLKLKRTAEQKGFHVACFTKEMRDSTNDKKVKAAQEAKTAKEIKFLGVLIFGKIEEVKELTKDFPLIS